MTDLVTAAMIEAGVEVLEDTSLPTSEAFVTAIYTAMRDAAPPDHIETLEAAILYAAETTNDCHTSRKLFDALNELGNQPRVRMCLPGEE